MYQYLNDIARSQPLDCENIARLPRNVHTMCLRYVCQKFMFTRQVAPFWWSGNFSAQAEAIITQHAAQSGLSQQDNTLVQWCVYCAVTPDHPLSFALFNTLLDKISKPVKSGKNLVTLRSY